MIFRLKFMCILNITVSHTHKPLLVATINSDLAFRWVALVLLSRMYKEAVEGRESSGMFNI